MCFSNLKGLMDMQMGAKSERGCLSLPLIYTCAKAHRWEPRVKEKAFTPPDLYVC